MKTISDLRTKLVIYKKEKGDLERTVKNSENRRRIKIMFIELTILKFKTWRTHKELKKYT